MEIPNDDNVCKVERVDIEEKQRLKEVMLNRRLHFERIFITSLKLSPYTSFGLPRVNKGWSTKQNEPSWVVTCFWPSIISISITVVFILIILFIAGEYLHSPLTIFF